MVFGCFGEGGDFDVCMVWGEEEGGWLGSACKRTALNVLF